MTNFASTILAAAQNTHVLERNPRSKHARSARTSITLKHDVASVHYKPRRSAWGPRGVDTHPRDAVFNFSLSRT